MPQETMLCETCVGILEHRQGIESNRGGWMSFSHHKTLQSFLKSIREKCPVCWGLWRLYQPEGSALWNRAFLAEIQGEANTDHTFLHGTLNCYRRHGKELIITLSISTSNMYLSPDILPSHMASFILAPEGETKSAKLLPHPAIPSRSTSTSSPESFAQAKNWIERCRTTHHTCNSKNENSDTTTPWYPTRLLHIPAVADLYSPSTRIRIIHKATSPPSGPYLTLSHRWGLAHLIQLLSANISEFTTTGIPISSLPLTFRDALHATQNLGVEYIWIDSLCIIQDRDDLSDWIKEANLMHKVYTNGLCNLSASDADDSTEGLFREREPATMQGKIRLCMDGLLKDEEREGGGWYINTSLAETELWARNVPWAPINRRGWVFQERLLSPRILYFGRSQLFWECCESEACETHPEGLPEAIDKLGPGAGLKVLDPARHLERMRDDGAQDEREKKGLVDAMEGMWSDMVVTYSKCNLTMAGDKLIALSGIAQQMERVFGDEYVAGMWRSRLVMDLQWRVRPAGQGVRPKEYRAPSWCWASVDGMIHMGGGSKSMLQVVDVHLEFAVEGLRTGNLKEGCYVDVKGKLRRVEVKEVVGTGWETVDGLTLNPVELDAEDHEGILPPKPQPIRKSKKKRRPKKGEEPVKTEEVKPFVPRRIFAMVPREIDHHNDISILLLELVDPDKFVFRRIGMAYVRYENRVSSFWSTPDDLASLPGDLDHANGEHTIRVI